MMNVGEKSVPIKIGTNYAFYQTISFEDFDNFEETYGFHKGAPVSNNKRIPSNGGNISKLLKKMLILA